MAKDQSKVNLRKYKEQKMNYIKQTKRYRNADNVNKY